MTARPDRPRILLTGASGTWGRATLRELRERERAEVIALALPTPADREALAEFAGMPGLSVQWGDLTRYEDVVRAVAEVDLVLHVGAVVSPLADERPELAHRVNIGAMRNIVRAVRALPDPASVGVVGIGSVAETGDRQAPHHWGRIGDPVRVSRFDEYGQSKVAAEKILVESGLPRWAWLRQTGIFSPGMLEIRDPIMTHSVLDGVMEWVTVEDSARLLAGIASPEVPEEFWNEIHDIGGGEAWRLTNWELQQRITGALGVENGHTWYERSWFATQNFHGQWYTDSDDLEALVPFRRDTPDEALARAAAALGRGAGLARHLPAWVMRNLVMRPLAHRPRGTLHALRRGDEAAVAAHFGSREAWERIGDWSTFRPAVPSRTPRLLDHGFDEARPRTTWGTAECRDAATFRGGRLLTAEVGTGRLDDPLMWECAEEHRFVATARLVLRGGHWCPDCTRDSAGYARQAEANRFLAQLELAEPYLSRRGDT